MDEAIGVTAETDDNGGQSNEASFFAVAVRRENVVVDDVLHDALEATVVALLSQLLHERLKLQRSNLEAHEQKKAEMAGLAFRFS